jgi:peroxiredoxin
VFWRTVVRNSDENTTVDEQKPWARVATMAVETFRKLSTGASWSGHERNHLFMGGLDDNYQFLRTSGVSGLDDPGDSRAFATIDYDRDGWLDIVLGNVGAPRLRLLRNEFGARDSAADAHFVALRFVGGNTGATGSEEWSSRDGFGARVELELSDGRHIWREHRIDDGFKAQNSATMLIGIGAAAEVTALTVRWPSGREQAAADIASGTLVTIHEDPAAALGGEAFLRQPYRAERTGVAPASHRVESSWPTRMFPAQPSGQTLRLTLPEDTPDARLLLHLGMATWCAACLKELPALNELMPYFETSELAVVGVPCDPKDTPEMLQAWSDRFQPPYPVLTSITAEDQNAMLGVAEAILYQTDVLPFAVVTNAKGEVLLATWGLPTVSSLKRLLWLQEAKAAVR